MWLGWAGFGNTNECDVRQMSGCGQVVDIVR